LFKVDRTILVSGGTASRTRGENSRVLLAVAHGRLRGKQENVYKKIEGGNSIPEESL